MTKKKKELRIRSRINEFIPNELKEKLNEVCENRLLRLENNGKSRLILQLLDDYGVNYTALGPGTNRTAVLIDGYVFKFAMDQWGKRDNANEYAMSEELQPFVIKVYESNDLIIVTEYITVFSPDDFAKRRVEIMDILGTLAESYLIGDVGYHPKNFTNWGFRDNGEMVILDFAYIYNIVGDELLCSKDKCGGLLQYDSIFHDLVCPSCRSKYTFMDARRLVTLEQENEDINREKANSFILKTSEDLFTVEDGEVDNAKQLEEELENMKKEKKPHEITEIVRDDNAYEAVLEAMVGNGFGKDEEIKDRVEEQKKESERLLDNIEEGEREESSYNDLLDSILNGDYTNGQKNMTQRPSNGRRRERKTPSKNNNNSHFNNRKKEEKTPYVRKETPKKSQPVKKERESNKKLNPQKGTKVNEPWKFNDPVVETKDVIKKDIVGTRHEIKIIREEPKPVEEEKGDNVTVIREKSKADSKPMVVGEKKERVTFREEKKTEIGKDSDGDLTIKRSITTDEKSSQPTEKPEDPKSKSLMDLIDKDEDEEVVYTTDFEAEEGGDETLFMQAMLKAQEQGVSGFTTEEIGFEDEE